MTLLYALAFVALAFVGYLIRDFYNEQLRERLIPIRQQVRNRFSRKSHYSQDS